MRVFGSLSSSIWPRTSRICWLVSRDARRGGGEEEDPLVSTRAYTATPRRARPTPSAASAGAGPAEPRLRRPRHRSRVRRRGGRFRDGVSRSTAGYARQADAAAERERRGHRLRRATEGQREPTRGRALARRLRLCGGARDRPTDRAPRAWSRRRAARPREPCEARLEVAAAVLIRDPPAAAAAPPTPPSRRTTGSACPSPPPAPMPGRRPRSSRCDDQTLPPQREGAAPQGCGGSCSL